MNNTKKRRRARIKQYVPDYINEAGQVDGEKLGLAMLRFAQGVLDKVKAMEEIKKPAPPEPTE
jgi:hypothetical protein